MEEKAKIVILGAAAVLVSGVKLDDWKLVEKYEPQMMLIVNEHGEELFKVTTSSGTGSVNRYGICWGTHTDEKGHATVTVIFDDEVTDKKAAVKEIMGSALIDLMDIESEFPTLLKDLRERQATVAAHISQV